MSTMPAKAYSSIRQIQSKGWAFCLIALAALLLALPGCKVQLLPDYDAGLVELIGQTARKVDYLYIMMADTDDAAKRNYSHWVEAYADIEADLGLLMLNSKAKPLNSHSVRICEITLELWQKYKKEHKQNDQLSNAAITLNRMYMADLFHAMLVAEKAKEMATEPHQ
jgi:hypothetical protein